MTPPRLIVDGCMACGASGRVVRDLPQRADRRMDAESMPTKCPRCDGRGFVPRTP